MPIDLIWINNMIYIISFSFLYIDYVFVCLVFAVKGLQILATFPASFSPLSKSIFENILIILTSIVTSEYNNTLLWKQALKALVSIGSFIEEHHESEKALYFMAIVVEKIVSLASFDDFGMPASLKLEAIYNIGATGLNYMLKIVQGLEEAISANLSNAYVSQFIDPLYRINIFFSFSDFLEEVISITSVFQFLILQTYLTTPP